MKTTDSSLWFKWIHVVNTHQDVQDKLQPDPVKNNWSVRFRTHKQRITTMLKFSSEELDDIKSIQSCRSFNMNPWHEVGKVLGFGWVVLEWPAYNLFLLQSVHQPAGDWTSSTQSNSCTAWFLVTCCSLSEHFICAFYKQIQIQLETCSDGIWPAECAVVITTLLHEDSVIHLCTWSSSWSQQHTCGGL